MVRFDQGPSRQDICFNKRMPACEIETETDEGAQNICFHESMPRVCSRGTGREAPSRRKKPIRREGFVPSFHASVSDVLGIYSSARDVRHFSNRAQRRAQWSRDLPDASLTSLDDTWSNPASLNASINASLSLFRNTEESKPDIAWNFVPETMTPPGLRTLITSRSDLSSGSQKYTQFWLKICERYTDLTYRDSLYVVVYRVSVCGLSSLSLWSKSPPTALWCKTLSNAPTLTIQSSKIHPT